MTRLTILLLTSLLVCATGSRPVAAQEDPVEIVQAALDLWRSDSSWSKMTMVVHRPSFERTLALEGWTRGKKDAISRFTKPAKDAGNSSLRLDNDMWMFAPKLNQVMKLPSSMMSQAWMGSDFSYDDLAKSDRILVDYKVSLTGTSETDGHTVFSIEAIPHDEAPVVWGKLTLEIRDDWVILEEVYFDQDLEPLRKMTAEKIGPLGGRTYAIVMRMVDLEEDDHWTEVRYDEARFDIDLPDYLFSMSNLQNPRPWKP